MNDRDAPINSSPASAPLSTDGMARRDAMLPELLDAMYRHHARRKAARRALVGAGIGAAVVALAWGVSIALSPRAAVDPLDGAAPRVADGGAEPGETAITDAPVRAPIVAVIVTDPMILDRSRAPAATGGVRVRRLDDEALLALLDDIGRPAGLIRMKGETRLTRAVADDEPGLMPGGLNLF